jgi:hypothetical protein
VLDRGPSSRPGCAVRCQAGDQAKGQRAPGDLGFPREQDLPDQFQSGVPAFGFAGVVEAGRPDEVRDRLGAVWCFAAQIANLV